MTITSFYNDVNREPQWVAEGNIGTKIIPIYTFEVVQPKIIEISQIKQSRIERIIKNITKLYQNNIAQDTMLKQTKFGLKWKSYYNRIKTVILGEK